MIENTQIIVNKNETIQFFKEGDLITKDEINFILLGYVTIPRWSFENHYGDTIYKYHLCKFFEKTKNHFHFMSSCDTIYQPHISDFFISKTKTYDYNSKTLISIMKTNETTLREIYSIGNKEVKERMEKEYSSLFSKSTLLDEAIQYLTEQDEEVIKLKKLLKCLDENDNMLAEQKLITIFKHKNEKHIFDWDGDSKKYFLWWYLGKDFRLNYVDYDSSGSSCSPRLCLKSRELAEDLSKELEIINYFKLYLKQ